MIVLDEQLLGRNLEQEIARWYRGAVSFIVDPRPHTVIKDDAIPELLRQHTQPTFVTINEQDFWLKIATDARYCVVCFALPDSRANEIASLLRSLFRYSAFRTKAQRMGRVIRVAGDEIIYYSADDRTIRTDRLQRL